MAKYSYKGYDFEVAHEPSAEEFAQMAAHVDTLPPKEKTTATSAAGKEAVESLLPTAGGIAGAVGAVSMGSPLIAAASSVPVAGPALGIATGIGLGVAGGMGAGHLVKKAQDEVMSYVPESFKESLGFGKEQRAAERKAHPDATFAGGLAPSVLAFRPGAVAPIVDKLSGKVIASPLTQRAGMAGIGGGIEAGSQYIQTGDVDWKHAGMAGAWQGVAATPTKLAKKVFPSLRTEELKPKDSYKVEDILTEARAAKEAADTPVVKEERIVPDKEAQLEINKRNVEDIRRAKVLSEESAFGKIPEEMSVQEALEKQQSPKAEKAQQAVEERQAALQEAVHTQATRDLSVAEYARQEQAGWPTTHTDTTPSVSTEALHPVVAAAEKNLEAAQERVVAVQEKVANGDASPVKLKQAQAAATKAEQTVVAARRNLDKSPTKLKGQRGAIFLGDNKPEPKINFAKKAETDQVNKTLGDLLPEFSRDARTPEEVVLLAQKEPDVPERLPFGDNKVSKMMGTRLAGKAIGQHTKGMLFETLRSNNAIQKFAKFELSDAVDAATLRIKELVDDTLAPAWRKLSDKERIDVHQVLQAASKEKLSLTPELLAKHGFNEKQLEASRVLTEIVHPANLEAMNTARRAAGKKEIPAELGYMLGMADGNFKTVLVKDRTLENGTTVPETVGVVGSNYRWIRDSRVKQMLATNPEWRVGIEKYNGVHKDRQKGDSLMEALMLISDNNPNMAAFSKAMDDVLKNEAYHSLGAVKHTKGKKGVIGMQGDQPWIEGERNWYGTRKTAEQAAREQANDFIDAQVRGTQVMTKWGALSEAVQKINKVLDDPSIQESQKRAIQSVRDYVDTTMGKNPSAMGQAIDNAIGVIGDIAGIGPASLTHAGSISRALVNNNFFTLNPIYYATNVLQPSIGTPVVKSFMKARGIEVSMDPTALTDLANMGAISTFMNKLSPASVAHMPKSLQKLYEADKAMWKYGNEHGMSSSQIVLGSPHTKKDVGFYKDQYFDRNVGALIEGAPRALTYASLTHMLRKAGFEKDPQLFPVARQLTDLVMGDYRHHEQAKIHENLGMLGNVSRNLTSYPLHQKGLIALLAREGMRGGSWKPFGVALATAATVSGMMGMYGYKEADFLVTHLSGPLTGKPTTLDQILLDYADKANKQTGSKTGDALAMGAAAFAGINLSGNLGQSSFGLGMSGGMGKAMDIGESVYDFAKDPSGWNAKMLVKEAGGAPARIAMANAGVTTHTRPDGETFLLNKKGKSDVKLNAEDVTALKMGARGSQATKVATQDFGNTLATKYYQGKQTNILEKITKENANTHGKISAKFLKEMASDYTEYQGTPENFVKFVQDSGIALNTSLREELLMRNSSGSLSGAYKLKRGYAP